MDRATLIARTVARLSDGIGTMARSSRNGALTTYPGRSARWRADAAYWRLMNSMMPTRVGIRITTRYAPPANFSNTTIASTTAVRIVPRALIAIRRHHPGSRLRRQWRTMPPWLNVKHTNTPTEYSGMSSVVTPPKATISTAATADRRTIPQLNASRSPRNENWRGM